MNLNIKLKRLVIGGALILMPFLAMAHEEKDVNGIDLHQDKHIERDEFRSNTQTRREAYSAKIQQRVDGLKRHFGEVRARAIEQFFGNMVVKMENAIDRLNSFADRLGLHLEKLSVKGNDVSKLKTELETARTTIHDAQLALEDAKAKFAQMALSNDPKKIFKEVKILISQASQKIKDARQALLVVIKSAKSTPTTATTTNSQ